MQVFRLIVVPQALRIALPPTVNEFITLLKTTSLASVISLTELMAVTQQAVASTFRYAEFYAVAALYYLVMVLALMAVQARVERRFAWASGQHHPPGRGLDPSPVTPRLVRGVQGGRPPTSRGDPGCRGRAAA